MANERNRDENLKDKSIRFEDFPVEILLKILNFLDINNLLKCSQTSKRTRIICYDKSLWQKVNLSKMRVPIGFLQKVIKDGCKCLNLNEARVVGALRLGNKSQLTNLDLSGCSAMSRVFEDLLKSCHYLTKLTFTQPLNFKTLSAVTSQNGKTLKVLNCWREYQGPEYLDLKSIQLIIENCTELKELSFWNGVFPDGEDASYYCAIYDPGTVDYLMNNISPNIETFSARECAFTDEHIKILVSRCTKIKELRFAFLIISNDSVTHIIDHLKPTLEKLDLANIDIDYQKMVELKLMPNLKSLDCLCYRSEILHQLREQLPDVSVNGYPPMATICKKKKVKYDEYFDNDN